MSSEPCTVIGMTATELKLLIEARDAAHSGRGRRVRVAAGLSQAELADAVGVSPVAISRWEADGRRPRGHAAVQYALILRELEQAVAA
jgi:DNA-binding XRE family transcriptional regulator